MTAALQQETFFPEIADPRYFNHHTFIRILGWGFLGDFTRRMVDTTVYTVGQSGLLLDDCVAYLTARGKMENPDAPLVANLLPDQAWHVLQLYNEEYRELCMVLAGQWLRHDPAGESVLVNRAEDTARTVALFQQHGIGYHPELWEDHRLFPNGGEVIRTGIRPR